MLSDDELLRLADDYGTPLYAFDTRDLAPRVARLRAALPRDVALCYAVKANAFVLPALEPLVERLEVCSPGELRICRALGVPGEKVVLSGVNKDEPTVDDAVGAAGVPSVVTVESASQLALVRRVARARGLRVPVLLRLSSGNQFGLDRADLERAAREATGDPFLELRGVQFFSGTQKGSVRRIRREVARTAAKQSEKERLKREKRSVRIENKLLKAAKKREKEDERSTKILPVPAESSAEPAPAAP